MVKNLKNLLTPLKFLRIKSEGLFWYQWTAPALLSFFSIGLYYLSPVEISIFGDRGILSQLNSFFGVVIGFYIAGLAAISSFPAEHLDREISGHPTVLRSQKGGVAVEENLTRRRLMAYSFGYCVFIAIVLLIIGTIASGSYFIDGSEPAQWLIKISIIILYIYLSASLLVVTLFNLHYLTERMHRE